MTKKTKAELARHQHDAVYTQWMSRPAGRRCRSDIEDFADDLWAPGPCMGGNRQMVNSIIRDHMAD